jgi:hypothetical protein
MRQGNPIKDAIAKASADIAKGAAGDGVLTSKVALTIKILGVEFQFLESHEIKSLI